EDIDAANPIAPDRAARARLDYLALGDWHGCKRIDERTWYSGTPEPDRFKDNGAGQCLLVEIDGPGAVPRVTPRATATYRWRQIEQRIDVASDIEQLAAQLQQAQASDVIALRLTGDVDLAGQTRLLAALGAAEARVRSLRRDLSALRLRPTADDIAALQADGYLGSVITELRDADGPAAQEALAILTTLLAERRHAADGTTA
ncbi:MAG: DNA repair exonuclease, partial [Alphaproteobacteria bacterium]|nr:DNA repair exonuclease [Alphaproteobacteria bacterium]